MVPFKIDFCIYSRSYQLLPKDHVFLCSMPILEVAAGAEDQPLRPQLRPYRDRLASTALRAISPQRTPPAQSYVNPAPAPN